MTLPPSSANWHNSFPTECDKLLETLLGVKDQLGQMTRLLDAHWAGALTKPSGGLEEQPASDETESFTHYPLVPDLPLDFMFPLPPPQSSYSMGLFTSLVSHGERASSFSALCPRTLFVFRLIQGLRE